MSNNTREKLEKEQVKKLFKETLGVEARNLPEHNKKTPDFLLLQNGKELAFCEIKSLGYVSEPQGLTNDPTFNRICKAILKGVEQMESASIEGLSEKARYRV